MEALEKVRSEIKSLTDGFVKDRQALDERMKEIETGSKVGDELIAKMTKMDETVSRLEALHADAAKLAERMDALEAAAQRTPDGKAQQPAGPYSGPVALGLFLQDVVKAESRDGGERRKAEAQLESVKAGTGLSEGVPSDGGFLVQQDQSSEFLKRIYEVGAVASRVKRIGISSNANGLRIPGVNETSRADGSRYGGILAYWTDESGTKVASHPELRMIELSLHKLTGLCYLTDELIQDAGALQAVVSDWFVEEMNFQAESAFLRGTGAGMPLGILNSGARVATPTEVGQAVTTIVVQNIHNMYSRMYSRSRQNAAWFINQDIEPQLFQMTLNVGTGGIPVYMPPGGVSGAPFATLMGRPVIPVEYCSTLGTEGDIMFLDLSQYVAIDKGGVQSASSIHVRFVNDESVLRWVYRLDGQPTWGAPLTPFQGTNTQTPYVTLAGRP